MKDSGYFGDYGGQYVPESLVPLLDELSHAIKTILPRSDFRHALATYNTQFTGRPSPLYFASRLTEYLGGASIYFKRDELNHTGAHKINNCIGQVLLAKYMNKTRIIAETGAGQHGVATATVCAALNLSCVIYMGETDIQRQHTNVQRMTLLGATIKSVKSGTLKDAMNAAIRDWVSHVDTTYYAIGTAAGPHPYPMLVRHFQSIIGEETKHQCSAYFSGDPDTLVACVGGGSNAIGLFSAFLDNPAVACIGVEPAGAAPLSHGTPGILHGCKTYLLQTDTGQLDATQTLSAGLDYPGVGPEHSFLKDTGRVQYVTISDTEAIDALKLCARYEGIIPALEPAHALAHVMKIAPTLPRSHRIIMNVCGRGDKDMATLMAYL